MIFRKIKMIKKLKYTKQVQGKNIINMDAVYILNLEYIRTNTSTIEISL